MTTLIDKLRAAETGSPNLSAEVFKHYHPEYAGWEVSPWDGVLRNKELKKAVDFKDYTQSIDAALTLVPEGWTWVIDASAPYDGIEFNMFSPNHSVIKQSGSMAIGDHKSLPIAICIAVLSIPENKRGV